MRMMNICGGDDDDDAVPDELGPVAVPAREVVSKVVSVSPSLFFVPTPTPTRVSPVVLS